MQRAKRTDLHEVPVDERRERGLDVGGDERGDELAVRMDRSVHAVDDEDAPVVKWMEEK